MLEKIDTDKVNKFSIVAVPVLVDRINQLIETVNLLAKAVNPVIAQKLKDQELLERMMMSQGRDECIQDR